MTKSAQLKPRPDLKATVLQIDLTDSRYKTLADFGARLRTLLDEAKIRSQPDAVGVIDDLLGAVYSLILARHHLFDDRINTPIEIDVVQKRAAQIENGDVRIDGKWIAGWHFNSALFRIAAVFHRLSKLALGTPSTKDYVPTLLPKVKSLYRQWTNAEWSSKRVGAIHDEVNTLKHTPQGVHSTRYATFEDALTGVGELVDLIETWNQNAR